MTNLNVSMANDSAESFAECECNYEMITNNYANCGVNHDNIGAGAKFVQDKLNLSNLPNEILRKEGGSVCDLCKIDGLSKKESLKMTNFICRNYENNDIIKNNLVEDLSTLKVCKKENVGSDPSFGLGDGQNMEKSQVENDDFGKISGVVVQKDEPRRSDAEKLTPQEQMNLLIKAEREKLANNSDQNLLKNTKNLLKNTDGNITENVIPFVSNSRGGVLGTSGNSDRDLSNLIAGVGGESAINERLEKVTESAIEKLKNQGFVAESVGENVAVKPCEFDYSSLIDNAKVEAIFNALKKPYKCDLLNMDLRRSEAKSWPVENWVKFFLKSVKSASFTVKYYDRMFDRQVRNSFYSEHIARFGSIENFFDELTDLMARKRRMMELKSFAKRLYKELSDVEILIVDKLVFGADNIDEIKKHISLRTMYRKADKIVPKLVEFMNARGFTPEWCYQTFGEILN